MKLSSRIQHIPVSQTLVIEARAKELKAQGIDVISFTVGEPDFDTPLHIKNAGIEAIKTGFTKYTAAEGIPELRKAITEKINQELHPAVPYDWTQTMVSNGSKQAFYNFFQVVLEKRDEVILPSPYWLSFPAMIELASGKAKIVKTTAQEGFKLTPDKLKRAITKKTKAVVINSPSNPTGATYTEKELRALLPILEKQNIWILSDEAYYKLVYDGLKFSSFASLSSKILPRVVIFRTCSKSYAMTGWRLGSVTGPKALIAGMTVVQSQSTSSVNSISQKAALAAIIEAQSEDGIKAMVKEFDRRRLRGLELLSEIPETETFRPQGAFYFFVKVSDYYRKRFKGNKIQGSSDLAAFLLDQAHVAVIPGEPFGADDYIRLSFATSIEKIETGIQRIKDALKKLT